MAMGPDSNTVAAPATNESFYQYMWSLMHRNIQNSGTCSTNNSTQYSSLRGCVAADEAEFHDTDTAKCGLLPCPYPYPNLSATLIELILAQSVDFDSSKIKEKNGGYIPFKMID